MFAEMGVKCMKLEEKQCDHVIFFSCRCVGTDLLRWVDFRLCEH